VYPPPPTIIKGIPNPYTNFTHSPCPFVETLNAPNLSKTIESAPVYITITFGRNFSTQFVTIRLNIGT